MKVSCQVPRPLLQRVQNRTDANFVKMSALQQARFSLAAIGRKGCGRVALLAVYPISAGDSSQAPDVGADPRVRGCGPPAPCGLGHRGVMLVPAGTQRYDSVIKPLRRAEKWRLAWFWGQRRKGR